MNGHILVHIALYGCAMYCTQSIDDGVSFATLQHEIERFKQHKKKRVAEFCKGVTDNPTGQP